MIVPQEQNFQLPPAMSTGAAEVDWLYMFLYWFSVVFTVVIWGATAYFVVKYKRQKGVKAEPTQDYTKLELFWTITPLIGIVFLFHWGYTAYVHNATAAEGSMEVRVRGKRWSWAFEYPTGDSEPNDLYLPVNKPVKLILSSEDVLHSFYIPAFRQKRDAVPGMYSFITFTPNQLGEAQVFCAEYCGKDHSYMLAKIHVVTDEEYKKHIDELSKMPNEFASLGVEGPAKWGESLFKKNNCTSCHSVDGSKIVGPSMKGIFGTPQPTNAGSIVADENYLRESILKPQAKIVTGFENAQMPPFVFKDAQIDALIAYIKSVK
ncbi:MAG: cytochrome c oxidase subunit II [Myxococcales bacterium]|nr:cytochrome c oxidase subunit II [Myxococcales bacterium]